MPDDKPDNIPEIFFDFSPEEILQRCLDFLKPLNADELKATIATGHKVVILDSDTAPAGTI